MIIRALIILNLLIGVFSGAIIYNMLPYAASVACELNSNNCNVHSETALWGYSFIPMLIAALFVFCYFKLKAFNNRASDIPLYFLPCLTVVWLGYLAFQS